MQILKKSLMTLALAGVAFASQATPTTVNVQFTNPIFGGFSQGDIGYDALTINFAIGNGSKTEPVHAGRFKGAVSSTSNSPNLSLFVDNQASVLMYCYDIYQFINHGAYVNYSLNYDGVTANTLDFLGAVNSVIYAAKSAINSATVYDPYAWLHPKDGNQGAAIQLGIWESLYDTTWDITAGNFKVTEGMDNSTDVYLAAFRSAMPGSDSLNRSYTLVLESPNVQDMITGRHQQLQQFGVTQVPEPGSLALIGLALVGLAASRHVRKTA